MLSSLLLERLDPLKHAGPVTPFAQDAEVSVAVTVVMLASVESLTITPQGVAVIDAVLGVDVCFVLPQPSKIPHAHKTRIFFTRPSNRRLFVEKGPAPGHGGNGADAYVVNITPPSLAGGVLDLRFCGVRLAGWG